MEGNVLVVDDDKEIAELLDVYLTSEGFTVHRFYSAEPVLEDIEKVNYDAAILDVMLPDMDGFSLCKRIREKWVFPIIMLTAKGMDNDKILGITVGADDYITKPFNPLEVVARVKASIRRVRDYDGAEKKDMESIQIRGLTVNKRYHRVLLYDEEIELTSLEFKVVWYLLEHMGQVVPSEELFENVWGEKFLENNNNTVMAHIARIREKLHENSRNPEYIKTVWGVGYKIEE